jgi:hypothetical protein
VERIMRIAAGSIIGLVLLASCSGDITQPADPAAGGIGTPDNAVQAEAMRSFSGTVSAISPGTGVSRWISADYGGVVSTGRFTLCFPAGAVAKSTFVTIKTVKVGGSMECEIFPSDLVLGTPATLLVDLRGIRSATPLPDTILWFDSQGQAWVDVGATPGSRGLLLATQIGRLGRYTAGWAGR